MAIPAHTLANLGRFRPIDLDPPPRRRRALALLALAAALSLLGVVGWRVARRPAAGCRLDRAALRLHQAVGPATGDVPGARQAG